MANLINTLVMPPPIDATMVFTAALQNKYGIHDLGFTTVGRSLSTICIMDGVLE